MIRHVSTALVERVRALAAAEPGREVCGLLLGDGTILPCANVAADPADSFEIDPAALVAAHRAARGGGAAVIGCYHSHPNGVAAPSARDAAAAHEGQLWLIVAGAEMRLFRFGINGFVELALGGAAAPPCLGGDPQPLTRDGC